MGNTIEHLDSLFTAHVAPYTSLVASSQPTIRRQRRAHCSGCRRRGDSRLWWSTRHSLVMQMLRISMIINRLRPRRDSSLQIMMSPLWTLLQHWKPNEPTLTRRLKVIWRNWDWRNHINQTVGMVMLENKDFICVQCPTIQYFRLVLTKEKQKRTKSNLLVFSTSW